MAGFKKGQHFGHFWSGKIKNWWVIVRRITIYMELAEKTDGDRNICLRAISNENSKNIQSVFHIGKYLQRHHKYM